MNIVSSENHSFDECEVIDVMEWSVKCPAKINLFLFVDGKREDGYHEILSLVDTISLCDEIVISESQENEVYFDSLWNIPEGNTVEKTIKLLSGEIGRCFKVVVKKRIPPGSGLGGASSDAGSIIREFMRKNLIDFSTAFSIAEKIGGDVPLFLFNPPTLIYGKGERVKEVKLVGREKVIFVVVWPNIISSTPLVYSEFDRIYGGDIKKIDFSILSQKEFSFDRYIGVNDLETAFLSLYKAHAIKDVLTSFGRFYLTGSGSAYFSIFFDEIEADFVFRSLKKNFQFVFMAKPFEFSE